MTDESHNQSRSRVPGKRLYLVAGANGSGKSTIARELLPAEGVPYVNPDDIARELCPAAPKTARVAAGREAFRRIGAFLDAGASFAVETTLSGLSHVRTLRRARERGYETTLIYIFVSSPESCIARIAARVKRGGHFIPDADVRRRYARSKRNFLEIYAPLSDRWPLLYNGSSQMDMVARKDSDGAVSVFSEPLHALFKE
jgi:predicted ABC-type ATPase